MYSLICYLTTMINRRFTYLNMFGDRDADKLWISNLKALKMLFPKFKSSSTVTNVTTIPVKCDHNASAENIVRIQVEHKFTYAFPAFSEPCEIFVKIHVHRRPYDFCTLISAYTRLYTFYWREIHTCAYICVGLGKIEIEWTKKRSKSVYPQVLVIPAHTISYTYIINTVDL